MLALREDDKGKLEDDETLSNPFQPIINTFLLQPAVVVVLYFFKLLFRDSDEHQHTRIITAQHSTNKKYFVYHAGEREKNATHGYLNKNP